MLNTELRKNDITEVLTYSGHLTHVVFLGTTDYLTVRVRHNDTTACPLYTDWQATHVTCTLL